VKEEGEVEKKIDKERELDMWGTVFLIPSTKHKVRWRCPKIKNATKHQMD
jgi:hypothetical protein